MASARPDRAPHRAPEQAPHRAPGVVHLLSLVTAALLGLGLLVAGTGTAQATTGYKYWNYFHVKNGAYVFATTGPSDYTPKDKSVEAYRYGLSTASSGLKPRTAPTTYPFAKICAGTHARSSQKRVGVLLDFGTGADAPSGQKPPQPRAGCALVPANATGQQVLETVAKVRAQKGLVCGVDGYPASGCSVTVKNPPSTQQQQSVSFTLPKVNGSSHATQQPARGGVPWVLIAVIVVVIVLAGAALALARRRVRR
jgi:hypothetical protein